MGLSTWKRPTIGINMQACVAPMQVSCIQLIRALNVDACLQLHSLTPQLESHDFALRPGTLRSSAQPNSAVAELTPMIVAR